jgi:xylan 1,4-beta-xylosidase
MVVVINQTWYYTAFGARAMYSTADPYKGTWSKVASMGSYPDPGMLVDDDGKVYMYSGCSSNGDIHAVELDPHTWGELGSKVVAVSPDYAHRGFEVGGDNNELLSHAPYVEGAWINKIDGRYYLQYAVPGTQYKSYADGLFVGSSPLGPFSFDPNSPMSSKPSGFAAGAGHSSTYSSVGAKSSLYHIGTISISVRANFERRLGIYPAFQFANTLVVDSYLGDYPHELPSTLGGTSSEEVDSIAARTTKVPKWMLLTYNKSVAVSSTLNASYQPHYALDEDIRTWWSAASGGPSEWMSVDMGGPVTVHALQVNFADQDCTGIKGARPPASDAYRWKVEYATQKFMVSNHAAKWIAIPELDRSQNTLDLPHDYVELAAPLKNVGALRITNLHMPCGSKFSLSGLRAFGTASSGEKPAAARNVQASRDNSDQRRVKVSWSAAAGAQFYVVRYGVGALGWLFHNVQVYGNTSVEINSLVDGQKYSFLVDSINEIGITLGTKRTMA